MPPRARNEWSWVGTEVTAAAGITPEHRRRAAGLGPTDRECAYKYDKRTVNSNGEGRDLLREKCHSKRCKPNPRCYNFIGGEEWLGNDTRDRFVEHNIGEEVEERSRPAGLRNYGATCYANAFLQLWYNNVAFRNGVYDNIGKSGSALYHLGSIFAMLQNSQRAVVDPGALVEALRLNKGHQQDAAEFSKLFMSVINEEFRRTPAKTFISDLFEGVLEYRTQCQTCGYTSPTTSRFLELEISLQDKTCLEDRIKHMLIPECLDGDNKYRCPDCASLQPATRSTHLKKLPPVLHFSLMRFLYDPYSETRKKSKASITYPRSLILNGSVYELRGVVVHEGTSATQGHFTCDVFNENDKEWYFYSDAEVSKLSERPRKRKLDADVISHDLTSKDAYMLVYKLQTAKEAAKEPPPVLMDAVMADNAAMLTEISEREKTKQALGDEYDNLTSIKRSVLEDLPGDDRIVPTEQLTAWLKKREPFMDWDFSSVSCAHKKIALSAAQSVKLISSAAYQQLTQYCNIDAPDVCDTCVAEGFVERYSKTVRDQEVQQFDALNEGSGYLVPKIWLWDWRKDNIDLGDLPDKPPHTLYCMHDKPWPKKGSYEEISAAALQLLRSVVGDFKAFRPDDPVCDRCSEDAEDAVQARATWAVTVKPEKAIRRDQLNVTLILNSTNYLLPKAFARDWERYTSRPSDRPILEMECCPHGLLDYDPELEKCDYLTERGWRSLCHLYDHNPEDCVTVTFTEKPRQGKTQCVANVSLATCDECKRVRLGGWEETWLTVLPKDANLSRTRSLRGTKGLQYLVQRSTTVREVKVNILGSTRISPFSQRLTYNGRELKSEETMDGIGYLEGEHLTLDQIEEVIDVDMEDEGFGGTALIGRISCPQCTFSNNPGSSRCDMCELDFE